jgi:hypothetical protein
MCDEPHTPSEPQWPTVCVCCKRRQASRLSCDSHCKTVTLSHCHMSNITCHISRHMSHVTFQTHHCCLPLQPSSSSSLCWLLLLLLLLAAAAAAAAAQSPSNVSMQCKSFGLLQTSTPLSNSCALQSKSSPPSPPPSPITSCLIAAPPHPPCCLLRCFSYPSLSLSFPSPAPATSSTLCPATAPPSRACQWRSGCGITRRPM